MKTIIKTFLTACFLATFMCAALHAQVAAPIFIVERGSGKENSFAFKSITEAIAALQDGDKFYIPAGNHSATAQTLTIDKSVFIIGAGCNPAPAQNSIILGPFVITGTNGMKVTGIRFQNLTLTNVSNANISRCYIGGSTGYTGTGINNIFNECEFRSAMGSTNSTNFSIIFNKCIFISTTVLYRYFYNSIFSNCLLMMHSVGTGAGGNLFSAQNTIFQNNIFYQTSATNGFSGFSNCTFSNNLFVYSPSGINDTNVQIDNIFDEPITNVFINHAAGDYRLKDECRGKGAGNDGRDVGIFGTSEPFKVNRLPQNPNISTGSVSSQTDADGKLRVKFKVEAQEK